MEEGAIRLGSIAVGSVQLDPTEIRGEGNAYDPRLIVPIQIEFHPQPSTQQIVLVRLSAALHWDQAASQANQFAAKTSYELNNNMAMCSVSGAPNKRRLDLAFNLTHAQLKVLENRRHQPGQDLYLHFEPVIAWNKHTGNADNRPFRGESTLQEGGWDTQVGMFSDFAFFWLPKIERLRLDLTSMNWGTKIFPGMGYDHFRLVEVKLPTAGARFIPEDAVEHFKKAMQHYDRGGWYEESLRECRLAHEALENAIEARLSAKLGRVYRLGRDHKLGEAIALDLGWPADSEQQKFLDGAWKPLYVMANASAHTPSTKSLLPADARVALLSTATVLEYLAQLE